MSFYNTNKLQGLDLLQAIENAKSQEEIIYLYWQQRPNQELTPEQVHRKLFERKGVPITSVRRAFSNLKKANVIYKTEKRIQGIYNQPVHVWKMRGGSGNQTELFS